MNLKNKIAIVTGAGSGIGEATAIELAKHGCTPVLVGRTKDKLERVLEKVRKDAPNATVEVCDICNFNRVEQIVQTVNERYGKIDILINNAGMVIVKFFDELSRTSSTGRWRSTSTEEYT